MGQNRADGDSYAPVRVGSAIDGGATYVLSAGNDFYGVSANLGHPATLTTPYAFGQGPSVGACSFGDRWKIVDVGGNATAQPITVAAGLGMVFAGGASSVQIAQSGSGLLLTVLDDGQTIQVDAVSSVLGGTNYESTTNTSSLPAANPLVFTSAPIARKGSGLFEVSANGCPVLTGGGGTVITFGLTRDFGTPGAVQLGTGSTPIQRLILPAGAGQHAEGVITPFIDVVNDSLPHTYSLVMSTASTTMTDNAGHQVLTVRELS